MIIPLVFVDQFASQLFALAAQSFNLTL